jgi:hypothetical protein
VQARRKNNKDRFLASGEALPENMGGAVRRPFFCASSLFMRKTGALIVILNEGLPTGKDAR